MELENVIKLINAVSESSLTSFSMEDGDTKLSLGADRSDRAAVKETAGADDIVNSDNGDESGLNKSDIKTSDDKKQYRTYKIARMRNLKEMDRVSNIDHGDIKKLMKESEQAYYRTSIPIEVQFANEETALMEEYFPDCPIEQISEDTKRMFIDEPAKER